MPQFIPGHQLNALFYAEVVGPLLAKHYPDLRYAAAFMGSGSDVLGFDTEMSTDHDWGPALFIVLRDQDAYYATSILNLMNSHLPHTFHGYPVNFVAAATERGTLVMDTTEAQPLTHRVAPITARAFFWQHLAYDIDQHFTAADWLSISSQKLRELTAGVIYHDDIGELTALQQRFVWYPHDVWLYLLASGWQRISQEEHLMPRAGFVGDELGSALIGSRLVHDIMSLCFLLEKQYAPYPKWFGTAFKQLSCAQQFLPPLWRAQIAASWQEREAALCEAYELLAELHNSLAITEPIVPTITDFFNRPFKVLSAERFAQGIIAHIGDPEVQRIAARRLIGNLDQLSDNTDLRAPTSWRSTLRKLYE